MGIPILVRRHLYIEKAHRLGLCNSLGPILVRHLSTEMAPRFGLCGSLGPILVRYLYIEMAPRLGGMCNSLWPILVRRPLYIEMAPRLELCNSLRPIMVRHHIEMAPRLGLCDSLRGYRAASGWLENWHRIYWSSMVWLHSLYKPWAGHQWAQPQPLTHFTTVFALKILNFMVN